MKKYYRQQENVYKYVIVNTNLREEKSTSANVITVIPAGSKVQVLEAEEDWYEVIYEGQRGFVYSDYLSTTKFTWTDVTLRSFPSAESNPVTVIPPKSIVQVLSTDGDWSRVMYEDQEGYVFNYFLSDDGNPPGEYDYTYFHTDMTRFVNDNQIKSPTANLITTDLDDRMTYIFVKNTDGTWQLIYEWLCTIGKPSTPTIKGTFYVDGRKPYFGSDTYRVKYATRIRGSYYYHSVLFNAEGTEIIDDRLGMALSHGCIRLAVENAHWIYTNILDKTTIIIN